MNLKICFVFLGMFLAAEAHAINLKNIPKTLECQMDISNLATTKIEFQTPSKAECETIQYEGGKRSCKCTNPFETHTIAVGEMKYPFYVKVWPYHDEGACPVEIDLANDDFSIDSEIKANSGDAWYGTTLSIHGQNGLLGIGMEGGGVTGSPCKVTSTF